MKKTLLILATVISLFSCNKKKDDPQPVPQEQVKTIPNEEYTMDSIVYFLDKKMWYPINVNENNLSIIDSCYPDLGNNNFVLQNNIMFFDFTQFTKSFKSNKKLYVKFLTPVISGKNITVDNTSYFEKNYIIEANKFVVEFNNKSTMTISKIDNFTINLVYLDSDGIETKYKCTSNKIFRILN